MKILFVFEHFHPYIGGAEELFLGLASSLAKNGNEVNVVTTLHNKELPRKEIFQGITIHRVNCHNRFLFTVLSLPKIISLARKSDFIHTASYNAAIPAFIASFLCRKKVFITFHEVWGKLWLNLPFKPSYLLNCYYLYEKFILILPFDKYIAVSEFTYNSLKKSGVSEGKIKMIYNGVDYAKFDGYAINSPSVFTFCYFGRLGISKGLDILLPAFQKVLRAFPDVHLKLIIPIYPEELYKKVMSLIAKTGIEKNITLLHDLKKHELYDQISTSSCVVIPSYSEGFCYAAAETTALNVPVISSGKGALTEVVGGNHIHLEELTVDNLAKAMEKAYAGKWDFSTPIKFTLDESTKEYLKLYREETGAANEERDF